MDQKNDKSISSLENIESPRSDEKMGKQEIKVRSVCWLVVRNVIIVILAQLFVFWLLLW